MIIRFKGILVRINACSYGMTILNITALFENLPPLTYDVLKRRRFSLVKEVKECVLV